MPNKNRLPVVAFAAHGVQPDGKLGPGFRALSHRRTSLGRPINRRTDAADLRHAGQCGALPYLQLSLWAVVGFPPASVSAFLMLAGGVTCCRPKRRRSSRWVGMVSISEDAHGGLRMRSSSGTGCSSSRGAARTAVGLPWIGRCRSKMEHRQAVILSLCVHWQSFPAPLRLRLQVDSPAAVLLAVSDGSGFQRQPSRSAHQMGKTE